jgi:hypothetical protein
VACLAALVTACEAATPDVALESPRPVVTLRPASPGTPAPIPSPERVAVFTLETRDCAAGACDRIVNVFADGAMEEVVPHTVSLGVMPRALVADLVARMEATMFAELKQHRRPSGCDASDGGREVVYTFHTRKRDQELSTCVFVLEHGHPTMVAADAVVAAILAAP